MPRVFCASFTVLLSTILCPASFGLAFELFGPQPNDTQQPGWAHNFERLPRHPSRVYSLDVNGNAAYYFAGDEHQILELIDLYCSTGLREHVVEVVVGNDPVNSIQGKALSWDVRLNLLGGIALWHTRRTATEAQTFEPTLTIRVSDEADRVLFEEYDWPDHVVVKHSLDDWRSVKRTNRTPREFWHALVQFEDGKPATDFEAGMTTTITLWDEECSFGFDLGKVNHDGTFVVALSKTELTQLKTGTKWLTMTVGNYLRQASTKHPRLSFDNLARDSGKARVTRVDRATQYFGRVLFNDGSPAVIGPDESWPGASISISFSFAGSVTPDEKGWFRVTMTADQMAQLQQKRQTSNVYIPDRDRPGHRTALYTYPAERLALAKDDVQPLKIGKLPPKNTN